MKRMISHSRSEETPEAKARWFQSLSLAERMEMLCLFTDLALENNPKLMELKDVKPARGQTVATGSLRVAQKQQASSPLLR